MQRIWTLLLMNSTHLAGKTTEGFPQALPLCSSPTPPPSLAPARDTSGEFVLDHIVVIQAWHLAASSLCVSHCGVSL